MATETVERSTRNEVRASSAPPMNGHSASSLYEKERQMVASGHQQHFSPSEAAGNPERKNLGRSARTLRVGDFALLRTLGTGESR